MEEQHFTLSPQRVDLWAVFPAGAGGRGASPRSGLHVLGRLFLRRVLSFYTEGLAWQEARTASGRPFVKGPAGEDGPVFNLSHTGGCLVLAISGAEVVGVDVERRDRGVPSGMIAARFFAKAEAEALSRGAEDLFFAYWTLKEAALKARGQGLETLSSAPSFAFRGRRPWRIAAEGQGGHCFALLEGPQPYLIGLCVAASQPPLLVRWRFLEAKALLEGGEPSPLSGLSCRPLALSPGVHVSTF